MIDSVLKRGVLVGWPYGGCAILVNNTLRNYAKLLAASKRFVIFSLDLMIIINVYMPNPSKEANNICDLMLSEITAVINDYPNSIFIFAGDMNCNLHDNYSTSLLIRTFISKC